MVVVSLFGGSILRSRKGADVPFPNLITIRPDAQTGTRNWPCRELNRQRTPECVQKHSRFGECFVGKASSGWLNSKWRVRRGAAGQAVPLPTQLFNSTGSQLMPKLAANGGKLPPEI